MHHTNTNRSRLRRALVAATIFAAGVAISGCCRKQPHPCPDGRGCESCPALAAALQGAGTEKCSPAQRVCLIAGDLPAIVANPEFVPASSYERYKVHVALWRAEAERIGKLPALGADAQALIDRLDLVANDEAMRRLAVQGRDLERDLRALAVSADKEVGPLPCPLPAQP